MARSVHRPVLPGRRPRPADPRSHPLAAPAGLLPSVRWLLLGVALTSTALAVAIIGIFSNAPPQLRLCSLGAIGWLAWWLVSGYRQQHFAAWRDLVALVALFVVGLGAADSESLLGVLYAALYFRALYATPMRAALVAVGFMAANLAALVVNAGLNRVAPSLEHAFAGTLALAMATVVVQVLRSAVSRRQQAMWREHTLRDAATQLLAASTAVAVYRAVQEVVQGVTTGHGRAALATLDGMQLLVFTARHASGRGVHQAYLEAAGLSQPLVEVLTGVQSLGPDSELRQQLAHTLGFSPELPALQLVCLLSDGQPRGSFTVATAQPLPREQAEVLEILADECSLALSRAALSEDLRRSEGRFRSLVQNSSDLILAIGPGGSFTYISPSVETLLGRPAPDPHRLSLADLVHPGDLAKVEAAIAEVGEARVAGPTLECRARHHDGGSRYLEVDLTNLRDDPYVGAVVLTARDVTERRELEDQLRHQALHDPLTGLANRALLRDRLEHALHTRRDGRSVLGLLSLDLDNFKTINDSYGHGVGDAVLLEVTKRIAECLRPADTFARLGGDEFAVLVEKVSSPVVVEAVAERIGEVLAEPMSLSSGQEVTVSASIGLITTKYTTADAEVILRDADIALYQAKADGKGRFVEFEPVLHRQAVQRMHVETGLRHALDRGELRLRYQPILSGGDHRLVGVEALLRWRDPDRSAVVSPDDFIEIAESTGLIVPIGRWVLYESCRQVSQWCREYAGRQDLRLSVNVSARQLQHPGLAEDVRGALQASGLSSRQLILEVTESTIVKDVKQASLQLGALRRTGVRIAIDDFGTGHSSLAQLQHLPVDEIKIDRSFMERLTDGASGVAVAESVVKLGRALSLAVVVEGVETAEQLALLESMSSDPMLQGFLFAEPLEPSGVAAWLGTDRPPAGVPRPARSRARRPAGTKAPASPSAPVAAAGPARPARSRRRRTIPPQLAS
ncbi:MAG: EAL domain-containing protein [Candidatus Dormibacteria bacterium]